MTILWALPAAVAGCASSTPLTLDAGASDAPAGCVENRERAIDLLLVVQTSGNAIEVQSRLVASAGALVAAIPHDARAHVGVVSADLGSGGYVEMHCTVAGDGGVLRPCAATGEPFADGGPEVIREHLLCMEADYLGCTIEMPLGAATLALGQQSEPGAPNHGFLRDSSVLAVVFAGSEDDCSTSDYSLFDPFDEELGHMITRCATQPERLEAPSRVVEELRSLREGCPERLVVGVISGVPLGWDGDLHSTEMTPRFEPEGSSFRPVPVCVSSDLVAEPAPRLAEVGLALGTPAAIGSACEEDYEGILSSIGERIAQALGE